MRQLQLLVSEDEYDRIADALDEDGFDHVRQRAWRGSEERWLVTVPLPTDAMGYLLGRLEELDVDSSEYTVISTVETAETERLEELRDRFASDFDPLTQIELRSKAMDMSQDLRSFLAMILLSAIIASAGLLLNSPAVVVGSMVIAPIVGPVLTAAVGTVTADSRMLLDSVWYQSAGIVVAIVGAWAFGFLLQFSGFVPESLALGSIDLIAVRVAPGILAIVVGLAAGGAGAYGLATKGPTSLIGVMVAAALIPAAATVGIAAAWNHPSIAIGSLVLVVITLILINAGAIVVLWTFGYRHEGWEPSVPTPVVAAMVLVIVITISFTAFAAIDQTDHERTIDREVEAVLSEAPHENFELITVRTQYAGIGSQDPTLVTVQVSHAGEGNTTALADALDRRLSARVDGDIVVRVEATEYSYAAAG